MTIEARPWPNVAIPPGEMLAEALEDLGISQAELARRAGRPIQVISEIVQGHKEITAQTAIELERVLGIPAHVWVRLEADYRTTLALLADTERLRDEIPYSKRCPYTEMAKLGWIATTSDAIERVRYLLSFFGVASLENLSVTAAWRRSDALSVDECALAAWLRKGELDAQPIDVGEFDPEGLTAALTAIRGFTCESPDAFGPKLKRILANLGVVLVFVPHLKKTGAHGATRWLRGKPVVQLSVRYKWADIFWFSLFHELAHLLLHGRRGVFVNFDTDTRGEPEREADLHAAQTLIPEALYVRFVARVGRFISKATVQQFAEEVGVHPGIVVGRLHHDGHLKRLFMNDLRERYELTETDSSPPGD